MRRKPLIYGVLFAVVLTLMAVTCVMRMFDQRAAAALAKQDLEDVRGAVNRITALRDSPTVAATNAADMMDVSRSINAALAEVEVDADQLLPVSTDRPERVRRTAYEQQTTQLTLQGVTLQQAVDFMLALTARSPGTAVQSLRLSSTSEDPAANVWAAEMTISTLVYNPDSAARGTR